MRKFFLPLSALLLSATPALAAGGHQLPLYPSSPFEGTAFSWISNSMIMVWIGAILIILFCRAATSKLSLVPTGFQNFAEWLIESLYGFFGNILGDHLVKRTFWFFGSTFMLILTVNYLALIPGVGTITFLDSHGHITGLLRGGNADLNMTGAMSITFALLWLYWAVTENGVKNFFAHIFAPKGTFTGIMKVGMDVIFFLVGILEIVSICIRPVALSFRLFGNIYGGEQTMEGLMALVPENLAFLPALPFYFMELLVGLVQALVFTLLSAVFLKLICEHSEEHH
ncbi:MAG TPA: F0F1 ATP synthase subunit A [Verrucomicrobiales bacterium]|nr:MAG: F0F1 ATP synthase subunit A [Verrucomicrobiae bacterium AMD-G2]HBE22971.1 F0F1 ATP synthase subunit A [Verrucomicrobiales bacterium]